MIHTRYEERSEADLQDLFHSSNWSTMSAEERLAACQEVANRDATSMGMEPVEVVSKPMTGAQYGAYNPNTRQLEVNSYILEDGQLVNDNGDVREAPGSNAETLDTVFHENSHAYDHQLREAVEAQQEGRPYNEDIIAHAQANNIDIDTLRASDQIYIPSGFSYNLQYCEAKAYNAGETKTSEYFEASSARLGEDTEYTAYRENLEYRCGFNEALAEMKDMYDDPNFDKTLNEQISNRYYADGKTEDEFTYGNKESRHAANNIIQSYYGLPPTDKDGNQIALADHSTLVTSATAQNDGTGNKNSMSLHAASNTSAGVMHAADTDDDSSTVAASAPGVSDHAKINDTSSFGDSMSDSAETAGLSGGSSSSPDNASGSSSGSSHEASSSLGSSSDSSSESDNDGDDDCDAM